MTEHVPVVVIVGGGFAGLAAAKALRRAPVRIVLIDRSNHHVFQPLLYQVAICALATGQIAAPIREILGRQPNTTVLMGEVVGVDKERKLVFVNNTGREGVPVHYDYLILATGATHSYARRTTFCGRRKPRSRACGRGWSKVPARQRSRNVW
jgi:NADH dehydrogenase